MLTHKIEVYKPVIAPPVVQVYHHTQPSVPKMDKLAYNNFLSRMTLKKGDYVINRFILEDAFSTLSVYAVFQVKDIQEIHYLCEYESNYEGPPDPRCVFLQNKAGTGFWSPPSKWVPCPQDLLVRHGYAHPQDSIIPNV